MSISEIIGLVSGILGIISFFVLEGDKKLKAGIFFIIIGLAFFLGKITGSNPKLENNSPNPEIIEKHKCIDLELDNGTIKKFCNPEGLEKYKLIKYLEKINMYLIQLGMGEDGNYILVSKKTGSEYQIGNGYSPFGLVFSPDQKHFFGITNFHDEDERQIGLKIYNTENDIVGLKFDDYDIGLGDLIYNLDNPAIRWLDNSTIRYAQCNESGTQCWDKRWGFDKKLSKWVVVRTE